MRTLTTGAVAKILKVTLITVHRLDPQLRPMREPGGYRRYDPVVVQRFAKEYIKKRPGPKPRAVDGTWPRRLDPERSHHAPPAEWCGECLASGFHRGECSKGSGYSSFRRVG